MGNDEDAPGETDPLISERSQASSASTGSTLGLREYFGALVKHFGHTLLVLLFVAQHLLKGFVSSFSGQAEPYVYRSYKVPAPQMQIYQGISMLPWAMKPIIGLVSDVVPVAGYNKAPYFVGTSIIGTLAYLAIGCLPQGSLPVALLVVCCFVAQLQLSTVDLLSEAKYAEKLQAAPDHGPALLTYVWFGMQFGGLVAVLGSGPAIHYLGPKAVFLMCAVPAAAAVVVVGLGYLEEQRRTPEEVQQVRQRFAEQREACALCLVIFLCSVALVITGLVFRSPTINFCVAMVAFLVVLVSFSVVLSPVIARFNAFALVQASLSLQVSGAAYFFYTDTPEQYPEGPHFSVEFFTSVLGIVGSVCSLIGIYSYQQYMKDWTYRGLLLMTNVVAALLSVTDVMVFLRLNRRWGLPDQLFVLGASALETIVGYWMWMPGIMITSQLCPRDMEATMYALLAGCHNLGMAIASNCGALVLELLDCAPSGAKGESAQFRNLWVASALSTLLPLGTLALLPWLIPAARQTDKILEEGERSATAGSVWRRLAGGPDTEGPLLPPPGAAPGSWREVPVEVGRQLAHRPL
mmetsp:Transcript_73033/g.236238  ORF Transcript_73033/g.236238 Transcript_73033/m.236238 type:complete len:577 (-) Transcript_73033:34-1764(-)